jgi:hypothetical protein
MNLTRYFDIALHSAQSSGHLPELLLLFDVVLVAVESKLEPEIAPRFREEEGLYVSKKPKVPSRSKNKLEQRIMASGSKG